MNMIFFADATAFTLVTFFVYPPPFAWLAENVGTSRRGALVLALALNWLALRIMP